MNQSAIIAAAAASVMSLSMFSMPAAAQEKAAANVTATAIPGEKTRVN